MTSRQRAEVDEPKNRKSRECWAWWIDDTLMFTSERRHYVLRAIGTKPRACDRIVKMREVSK